MRTFGETDMDDSEVARVAKGLTTAQQRALLSASDLGWAYITTFAEGRSAKALYTRGLTNLGWAPSSLTPLGLSVRTYLQHEQSQ
jgi:hypothetical protein